MSDKDLELTGQATARLAKLRPGLVCPFCHKEDTFVHQQRAGAVSYAMTLYDRDRGEFEAAYRMELISCMVCGYSMPFLPGPLTRYLAELEAIQAFSDDEGGNAG